MMSEIIDNQQFRQKKLKELITELQNGANIDEVKAEFKLHFQYVTGAEIADMERNLVDEGTKIEEIQQLCDIHASIFKGSVIEMHEDILTVNPLTEFQNENEEMRKFIEEEILPNKDHKPTDIEMAKKHLGSKLEKLATIEEHYSKKENILFPFLERAGIATPPKVMWGVDNNIRAAIRKTRELIASDSSTINQFKDQFFATSESVLEMIDKENDILFPMLRDVLREEDWKQVARTLQEEAGTVYLAEDQLGEVLEATARSVQLSVGSLTFPEVDAILNTLPLDITFVGADNIVKYVSQGTDRIFARPKTVIGRAISNCHPPQSVHIVEKIVEDLRSGKKDHEDFWIQMGQKFVYIRYFAVRRNREFLGVIEVTQDIKPIQALSGEKRLAD